MQGLAVPSSAGVRRRREGSRTCFTSCTSAPTRGALGWLLQMKQINGTWSREVDVAAGGGGGSREASPGEMQRLLCSQSLGTPSEPRPALLRAVRAHRVTTPALVTPFEYKTPQGTFGQVLSTFNHGTCRRLPAGMAQTMISLAQPLLKLFVCRS